MNLRTAVVAMLFAIFIAAGTFAGEMELRLRDSFSGAPVAGSVALDGQPSLHVDASARLDLPGPRRLSVQADGYLPLTTHFSPTASEPLKATLWLDPVAIPSAWQEATLRASRPAGDAILVGFVRDQEGRPVSGALVQLALHGTAGVSDRHGFVRVDVPLPPLDPNELPPLDDLVVEVDGTERLRLTETPLVPGVTRHLFDLDEAAVVISDAPKLLLASRQQLPDPGATVDDGLDSPLRMTAAAHDPTAPPSIGPSLVPLTPPTSIRLGFNCSPCTTCPQVEVMTLETYVNRGITDEWIGSWDQDSLRAGTIAYRSYGAWHVDNPRSANWDICNNACCQVNDADTSSGGTSAASATAGLMLERNGTVFRSEYSAENNAWDDPDDGLSCSNGDKSCGDGWAGSPATSWPCLEDAPCTGRGCFGHGRGMCQWGTQRWAWNQGALWPWITDHYYNANGLGSGLRTAEITTPITVDALSAIPSTVPAGSSFTLEVDVTSHAGLDHNQVMIGASLYSPSTGYLSDPAGDTRVTVISGSGTVSRSFAVDGATPEGSYDLIVALWLDVDGNSVISSDDLSLTSFTAAGAVTVGTLVGTCSQPIEISGFPYTDSNDTSLFPRSLDGYAIPPSSGSEAGPEVVYRFTITSVGTLTVSLTDPSGVDIDPHLLAACSPDATLDRAHLAFSRRLHPGTYWIVCDTWTSAGGTEYAGAYDLTVDFLPDGGDAVAPSSPDDLRGAATTWSWTAITTDRSGQAETMGHYQLTRGTTPTEFPTLVGSTFSASLADATVPSVGVAWFYQLRAVDAAGNLNAPRTEATFDNPDAAFVGSWPTSTSVSGYLGNHYQYNSTGGTGADTATWDFVPEEAGLYTVDVWFPAAANRSTESRFTVDHDGGSSLVLVDQQANHARWVRLGSWWMSGGVSRGVTLDDAEPAGFFVIADGLRWQKIP